MTSSAVLHLTISAIAESCGIKIPDNGTMTLLEQEAEKFIKQILKEADALYQATRSYKLTTDHIDMVLESRSNCQPLYGYKTLRASQPAFAEAGDLFGPRELQEDLAAEIEKPATGKPTTTPHTLQWTLVEGTYIGKRSQNNRKPTTKARAMERSVSTPLSSSQNDSFRVSPYALTDAERAETMCADDLLSCELQRFFVDTINLLCYDTSNSFDSTLDKLTEEDKMQPLIPYFLQWAFGKMTINLHKPHEMQAVMRLVEAIATDKSANVPLYAHPLLKIAFTGLLSISLSDDGDDRAVRETAARLLKVICARCETDFPQIREVAFNSLSSAIFCDTNTLAAQYGALVGIRELGLSFFYQLLPHIPFYVACLGKEINVQNRIQRFWCGVIFDFLKETLGSCMRCAESEPAKESCSRLIEMIERVDYE